LLYHQVFIGRRHMKTAVVVGNGLKVEPHVRDGCRPVGTAAENQTNGGRLSDRDGSKSQAGVVAALPSFDRGGVRAAWCTGIGCQRRSRFDGWIGGSLS
jgi:hypothetical protein